MVELPVPYKAANKVFEVTLDDVRYRLRLRWNKRRERWVLSIYNDADEPLALGLPVLVNWDFLLSCGHVPGIPAGRLLAICVDQTTTPPGRYELGANRRVRIYYEPTAST